MFIKNKLLIIVFGIMFAGVFTPRHAIPQTKANRSPRSAPGSLTLVHAVMCERIRGYSPLNPAVVFSVGIGKISCFVLFDPVPEEMFICHKWFHRDKLSTKQRLLLKPPRWSTFSTIQLREADKGPWRVEITDGRGHIIRVLRFSIVD